MKKLIVLFAFILGAIYARSTPVSFTADISYNGYADGEYEIYNSKFSKTSISNLRSPIIFVEGIDANNQYSLNNLWGTIYQDVGGTSLGQQLNNQG